MGIDCPHCGAEDNEIEIEIISGPFPGSWEQPGEGAEWSLAKDAYCYSCGKEITVEDVAAKYEDRIQERAAEPRDDF